MLKVVRRVVSWFRSGEKVEISFSEKDESLAEKVRQYESEKPRYALTQEQAYIANSSATKSDTNGRAGSENIMVSTNFKKNKEWVTLMYGSRTAINCTTLEVRNT
jgi:hypothetical protein